MLFSNPKIPLPYPMAKITIIVPVYNALPWLNACIVSILAQSERDWLLTLVDDGSTDGSGAVCDSYAAADARVEAVHTVNRGQSAARNTGIERARTELLFFVDADDCLHPDALSTLLTMREQSRADICIGGAIYAKDYRFEELPYIHYKLYEPGAVVEQTLYQLDGWHNSPWNILYSRHLFDELRFREGIGYEDLDLFYRLYLRANKIARTEQVTYLYRDNPASYLHTWQPGRQDVLAVTDRIVGFMAEHGSTALLRAARDRQFSAYYNMFALGILHDDRALADRCWPVIRAERRAELTNLRIRRKNRLGALVALSGRRFTEWIVRRMWQ